MPMSWIGCNPKTLRWVPHGMTCGLKRVRLTVCLKFLPKYHAHAHDRWQHLVTGDEIWFYQEPVRDQLWTAQDENTPEVGNRTIAPRKVF
jgi:hypothetical protein